MGDVPTRFLIIGRHTPYNGSLRPASRIAGLGPFTSEDAASKLALRLTERHGIETVVVDLYAVRQVGAFVAALTTDDDPRCSVCCGSGLAVDPAIPVPPQRRAGSRAAEMNRRDAKDRADHQRAAAAGIVAKHAASATPEGATP